MQITFEAVLLSPELRMRGGVPSSFSAHMGTASLKGVNRAPPARPTSLWLPYNIYNDT